MRELRVVGLGEDGTALLAECDGEHFRLPLDEAVRAALRGEASQLAMPLTAVPTVREIQARIRRGESAGGIAQRAGVPVERVARYEGPPLQERAYQLRRAQSAPAAGSTLAERVAAHLGDRGVHPADAHWDAWLGDDDRWRVRLSWRDQTGEHRAGWRYDPATRRLVAVDASGRALLAQPTPEDDDLTAVLRPVAARLAGTPSGRARGAARPGRDAPAHQPPDGADEAPDPGALPDPQAMPPLEFSPDPDPSPQRTPAPDAGARAAGQDRGTRRGRRTSVPAWERILGPVPGDEAPPRR